MLLSNVRVLAPLARLCPWTTCGVPKPICELFSSPPPPLSRYDSLIFIALFHATLEASLESLHIDFN